MMQRITAHYKFEGDKFPKHHPILLLSTIERRPLNISFRNSFTREHNKKLSG